MNIEAMGKGNRRAFADIVMHIFFIGFGLQFIGHGEHNQVAPSGRFCNAHHFQAFALGFFR